MTCFKRQFHCSFYVRIVGTYMSPFDLQGRKKHDVLVTLCLHRIAIEHFERVKTSYNIHIHKPCAPAAFHFYHKSFLPNSKDVNLLFSIRSVLFSFSFTFFFVFTFFFFLLLFLLVSRSSSYLNRWKSPSLLFILANGKLFHFFLYPLTLTWVTKLDSCKNSEIYLYITWWLAIGMEKEVKNVYFSFSLSSEPSDKLLLTEL